MPNRKLGEKSLFWVFCQNYQYPTLRFGPWNQNHRDLWGKWALLESQQVVLSHVKSRTKSENLHSNPPIALVLIIFLSLLGKLRMDWILVVQQNKLFPTFFQGSKSFGKWSVEISNAAQLIDYNDYAWQEAAVDAMILQTSNAKLRERTF